jgi:hypothetical protein
MRAAAGALERSWHDLDRPSPAARKARPEGPEESAKQAAGCTDHDHVRVYFLGEGGQLGGRRSLLSQRPRKDPNLSNRQLDALL